MYLQKHGWTINVFPAIANTFTFQAIYSKMKTLYLTLSFLTIFVYRAYAQDTIYLENYVGNLKKVNVTIGSKSYSFLFDTGGGETFISPEIAKSLGKPFMEALQASV